jgi:ribosomal-protein-alanine N-acetyltransferase
VNGAGPELRSERLLLRRWREEDREPFAAMNADPVVMEHFPAPLGRAESDALMDRVERGFEEHGFGLWALEARDTGSFLGFTGLSVPRFHASWMDDRHHPVVEVGWRLAREAWGAGLATEAARASLRFGFEELALPEVVSFTTVTNLRSQAVMRRLGMTRVAEYEHPVDSGSPLPSVACLLTEQDWRDGPRPGT